MPPRRQGGRLGTEGIAIGVQNGAPTSTRSKYISDESERSKRWRKNPDGQAMKRVKDQT
jgi:hypothetical protein